MEEILKCCEKNFNPRTPGGVRHMKMRPEVIKWMTSIHAPRVGCDGGLYDALGRYLLPLQSTHPGWGATVKRCNDKQAADYFNPRTPGWVRL